MRPPSHRDARDEDRDVPASRAGVTRSPGIRYGSVAGLMLAFLLLLAFYFTVAAAVHHAELRRQNARLEIDRRAACSMLAQEAERERCTVRLAQHGSEPARAAVVGSEQPSNVSEQPSNELLSTSWRECHVVTRRPHRTAGLY